MPKSLATLLGSVLERVNVGEMQDDSFRSLTISIDVNRDLYYDEPNPKSDATFLQELRTMFGAPPADLKSPQDSPNTVYRLTDVAEVVEGYLASEFGVKPEGEGWSTNDLVFSFHLAAFEAGFNAADKIKAYLAQRRDWDELTEFEQGFVRHVLNSGIETP